MLRWLILIVTFVVWLACMRLVYVNFSPHESENSIPESEGSLDNYLDESAEGKTSWSIYVDLNELKKEKLIPAEATGGLTPEPDSSKGDAASAMWDGHDEDRLVQVGNLEVNIKQTHLRTRGEEEKRLSLRVPAQLKSKLLQSLGEVTYRSRTEITMDQGIEQFYLAIQARGLSLDMVAQGTRDGNVLNVTTDIMQDNHKMMNQTQRIPISAHAAPNVGIMPFQRYKNIRENVSWEIPMVDTSSLNLTHPTEPKYIGMKVTCIGRAKIVAHGSELTAFVVKSEDGKSRSWYSADGVVLKQAFRFLDAVPVIVVRDDERSVRHRSNSDGTPVGRRKTE
jgi:hypothetical protein